MDIYIDDKPAPTQRVTELHCWIAIYDDGSEGIISTDLDIAGMPRHAPLLSSKRSVCEALRPLAERACDMAREAGLTLTYEMRSFTRIT